MAARAAAPGLSKARLRTRWMRAVVAAGLAAVGCTQTLDWKINNLPCDTTVRDGFTYFCQSGYSCETFSERCIRDNSLRTGGLCTQSRQCSGGDTCPVDLLGGGGVQGRNGVLSCLPGCNASTLPEPYLQPGGCSNDAQVCMPFLDVLAANQNKSLVGACVGGSTCIAGSACSIDSTAQGICVQVTASATACLQSCQVTWNGAAYSDNCDSRHTCQPVGLNQKQAFACVYNGKSSSTTPLASVAGVNVRNVGQTCAPVSAPCADGAVCVPNANVCAKYCQLSDNGTDVCPINQGCCPFPSFSAKPATGYCAANCSGT